MNDMDTGHGYVDTFTASRYRAALGATALHHGAYGAHEPIARGTGKINMAGPAAMSDHGIQLPAASPATVPLQHARRFSFEGGTGGRTREG